MKKLVSILLAAALVLCLSACGSALPAASAGEGGRLRIVTTIFPTYDWVQNILGENPVGAELTLLGGGVDLHSFQPTADDILLIAACDLFIYVGGESDAWVRGVLERDAGRGTTVLNLMELLGGAVREEETVEGMQGEEEEAEDGAEYDEHVWLSLRNAEVIVPQIESALEALDPAHAEQYRANADAYLAQLDSLDRDYAAAVAEAGVSTLLFGDRFPFRYLTEDYGLSYYAAFAGCSAETEASFETVTFLAEKLNELGLRAVLIIEGSDHRLAETIIRSTRTKDQKILILDSMQAAAPDSAQKGVTYLSVMERNLDVLKEALN